MASFLYGSNSSGNGGTLTVTAPAEVIVTVSKGNKIKTQVANSSGIAIFKGLETGIWTVTISDGSQTSAAYTVKIVANYAITVSFSSATIAVSYPEGSICTCSNGSTTLTAPDTSGNYTFTVPYAGTWVVACTDGNNIDSTDVVITSDEQTVTIELSYKLYLYTPGDQCTDVTGGWALKGWKDGGYEGANAASGTLTFNTTDMTAVFNLTSAYNIGCAVIHPKKDIDFSKYKTLTVDIKGAKKTATTDSTYGTSIFCRIISRDSTYCGASYAVASKTIYSTSSAFSNKDFTCSIDISGITGSYDIIIGALHQAAYSSHDDYVTLPITSVRLEL